MRDFEKIYQIDPSRETDFERENISIEMTDEQFLARLAVKNGKGVSELSREEFSMSIVDASFTERPHREEKHAKNKSQSLKDKPKKVPSKRNKAAVATIQKEL